jgi:hypothetical protein
MAAAGTTADTAAGRRALSRRDRGRLRDQRSADIVLEFKAAAPEPDDVILDLHPVACICAGTHVTHFPVLTPDPVGSGITQGCRKTRRTASGT